ncbi:MAG: response regulator [Solirubrobacterales bacterium]
MANILICDDAAFMRNSLRIMLEKGGHTVIGEAANGLEAVEQFKNMKPDLVTMDITMPEVDGLTALKMIRQLDPNAKVIMVSAMGQESMVKEAVLSGAKTFIVKPFKEAYILEVIAKTV